MWDALKIDFIRGIVHRYQAVYGKCKYLRSHELAVRDEVYEFEFMTTFAEDEVFPIVQINFYCDREDKREGRPFDRHNNPL